MFFLAPSLSSIPPLVLFGCWGFVRATKIRIYDGFPLRRSLLGCALGDHVGLVVEEDDENNEEDRDASDDDDDDDDDDDNDDDDDDEEEEEEEEKKEEVGEEDHYAR